MPSNSAKDLVPKKDSDKEVTEFEPRSSGEKKFRDSHTVSKTNHPVATDTQHKGSTDHGGEHKGYDGVPGERNADMKTFDQFRKMGGHGKSSYRSNDKSAGEKSPVMQGSSKVKNEEMSDFQMKKREDYVKGMKKNLAGFKSKYGDRAKEVMYATATKMAKK